MNGVTIRADDVHERMLRTANLRTGKVLRVAGQAIVQDLLRREFRKRDDRTLPSASLHVRLSRSVTALAPILRSRIRGNSLFEMRVFVPVHPDVRMAGAARVTSDITGGHRLRSLARLLR